MPTARDIIVHHVEFKWTRRSRGQHRETLSVWRADGSGGRLLIRFVDGQGGVTTVGSGWGGHDGGLLVGCRSINLNLPSVVAALIRQAIVEGWDSRSKAVRELDGFALLARTKV